MKILCINNDGGGFADYVEVAPGTTVHQLFQQQVHSNKPGSYLIRAGRQSIPPAHHGLHSRLLIAGNRILTRQTAAALEVQPGDIGQRDYC